jgi:xanthine phosphoribosyltransferase
VIALQLLEERILRDGQVKAGGILKVDSFLNHQIDTRLSYEMAREFYNLFAGCGINKILTIEASGIGLACLTGYVFGCPVLFAKKSRSANISADVYSAQVPSFTHGNVNTVMVSKEYLGSGDRVLIVDDFLATGAALEGLIKLVETAGGTVVGCGVAIEKAFQNGGELIRSRGYRVESLARIASMSDHGSIEFCR